MSKYNTFCVFCGSKTGTNPLYAKEAEVLGTFLGERQKTLLYGCGSTGLMREVAKATAKAGGKVSGITPCFFPREVIEQEPFVQKTVVNTMDERKVRMVKQSDIFIALPGGYGTLDELFELLVLNQLELIQKPVFLINTLGFYEGSITQLKKMVEEGFLSEKHLALVRIVENTSSFFHQLDFLEK